MAKSFSILRNRLSEQAQQKVSQKVQFALQELRQKRGVSQEKLAESLNMKQANVSRLEHRSDMYVSTLRNYINAMGGKLSLLAEFPEGSVRINQFEE